MMVSSSRMARTSSLILRWSIRIRATPCGESASSRSRSCSTSNVGPSGSCSRCLISLITSDLADPLIGSAHKGAEFFSVERAIGSCLQSYFARKPSSRRLLDQKKIRRPTRSHALLVRSWLKGQTVWMRLLWRDCNPSAFLDHMQFLAQFDPAAVWQDAPEIYAGVDHAITTDNRAGIDYRIAADLGSIADDCTEFSQARRNVAIRRGHRDFTVIEFYV